MKVSELLFCVALPLVMSAPRDDPLVTDFRTFLEAVFDEANGDWSQLFTVPDAQEDLAKDSDGWIFLRTGYLENLQNMSRDGDCAVDITGNTARVTTAIYIDELQFSYDFGSQSEAFQDVDGCVFGSLDLVYAQLSIEADFSDAAAVKATVKDMTFQRYGVLVTDDASMGNAYADFQEDLAMAVFNLMDKEIMPFLGRQIKNLMNSTLTLMTFDMSSTDFTPTTTTTKPSTSKATSTTHSSTSTASITHPSTSKATTTTHSSTSKASTTHQSTSKATTTTHSSTSKATSTTHQSTSKATTTTHSSTSKATSTTHPSTSKATTTTHSSTSKATSTTHPSTSKNVNSNIQQFPIEGAQQSINIVLKNVADPIYPLQYNRMAHNTRIMSSINNFGTQSPSKETIHIALRPRKSIQSRMQYGSRTDISCRLRSVDGNYNNENPEKIITYRRELPIIFRTPEIYSNIALPNKDSPGVKISATSSFNNIFDSFFNKTDIQLVRQKLEPLKLPDGEEELSQSSDGSVKLEDGRVYGMDTMELSSDPEINNHGVTARVSATVYFENITYFFNFSGSSKTFSTVSGTVRGNISRLSGQLSIVANLTQPTAVTASLKSFQLQPTVDFSMAMEYNENVTGKVTDEISDAVISDFKDNIAQKLTDRAAQVLRNAVANIQNDMSASLGISTRPSSLASTHTSSYTSTSSSPSNFTTTHNPNSSPSLNVLEVWYLILAAQVTKALITNAI